MDKETNITPSLRFVYTNWEGEKRERQVIPVKLWYGHTRYHSEDQWLLKAVDTEKGEERDFAVKEIEKFF